MGLMLARRLPLAIALALALVVGWCVLGAAGASAALTHGSRLLSCCRRRMRRRPDDGARHTKISQGGLASAITRPVVHATVRLMARGRSFAVVALAAGVSLSLAAGVAQANHIALGSFGSGHLTNPTGLAVDQSSHAVFVASVQSSNVNRFDSSGNLVSPPSPFGPSSQLDSGVAVNPVNHDVYVVDAAGLAIDTFDPNTGAQLSSFPIPGPGNLFGAFAEVQIATDPAGDVYVPSGPNNEVLEYSPTGTQLARFTGSGAAALSKPLGVAVDPLGNVWVADTGNNRIEEFDPTGATVLSTIASPAVEALAIDSAGDVFASVNPSSGAHVIEYSSAGAQLDDFGLGLIGTSPFNASGGVPNGVAVDDQSGKVYVADGGNSLVRVFGLPSAPSIATELAVQVTASRATLGARIAPGGLATSYRFEYGTTTAYGQTAPVPDGYAGSGVQPTTVWATVGGLEAGTTYHYRVVATNPLGSVTGPDHMFTTTAGGCPNDQFRAGFGAALPDCRAYELVTPANEGSGVPGMTAITTDSLLPGFQVAGDGKGATYFSQNSSGYYLATRAAGGWSSQNLVPPQSGAYGNRCTPLAGMFLYSADLSMGVLADGEGQSQSSSTGGGCGADDPNLVPGEPQGFQNLFLRDNTNGTYQLIDVTPPGVTPSDAILDAGSSDLSHVVFDEQAQLTPDAPSGADDLYEWTGGKVRLVTYVPASGSAQCGSGPAACTPVVGALAGGQSSGGILHAVSANGSRIFFAFPLSSPPPNPPVNGNLYVRESGSSTVQVDASQRSTPDPGGPQGSTWMTASADGSTAFFLSCEKLTDDSTANSSQVSPLAGLPCADSAAHLTGNDLYAFDVTTGKLSDLTVDHNAGDPVGADVQSVVGAGDDGSHLYLIANGVLAQGATPGQPNLYLYHAGAITFIATLAPSDFRIPGDGPFAGNVLAADTRVSPNGQFIAFTTTASPTGYDNVPSDPTACGDSSFPNLPCPEIFLYDAAAGNLSCVSCNPAGDPPVLGAVLAPQRQLDGHVEFGPSLPGAYEPGSVSDAGQVFFDTPDALLPADVNGKQDVYEYESGQLNLLSSGTSPENAWFANATPSGTDVFFVTSQQLLPQAVDTSPHLYDARVDGGFPVPPPPPPPCQGDACRSGGGATPPPAFGAPGSATFAGPGNQRPPVKAKPRSLTRAQKLAKALKACQKKPKRQRQKCRSEARRRFGAHRASTTRGAK